jgi:uncharacterized membrane protein YfcA
MNYSMDWSFLLIITMLATCGIFIGNQLTHRISSILLRKIFGWFILIVGCGILIRELTSI